MKGEKTVSPFTIPAVPQRNRSYALRSSPGSPISAGARASLHITLFQRHIRCCMKISRRRRLRACPGYPICHPPTPSPKIPGRGVNAIPGYSFADGWKPVAPVSAAPPGRLAADAYRLLCKNCLTRSESGLLKNFSGGAFSINNPFSRNTTSSETWRAKSIS